MAVMLTLSMSESVMRWFRLLVMTIVLCSMRMARSFRSLSESSSACLARMLEKPETALSGVRIWWLTFRIKAVFMRSASWAWSRATVSCWFCSISWRRCFLRLQMRWERKNTMSSEAPSAP